MVHFLSSEQHARSNAFDTLIANANRVLYHPNVVAQLGGLAADLRNLNNAAFLPNIHNGQFVAPKHQEDTPNAAIIPLTEDEQANYSLELIAPLLIRAVRVWDAPEESYSSKTYGITRTPSEIETFYRPVATASTPKGLHSGAAAKTQALPGRLRDGRYAISRAVVTVDPEIFCRPSTARGAIMAHELVHVDDFVNDGPLTKGDEYGAASELRAYHVSATILEATDNTAQCEGLDFWLNTMRKEMIGNHQYPFTPNAALLEKMKEAEII